jgi:exonuclease VII large subunit
LINALSQRVSDLRGRLNLSLTALEAGSPLAAMERGFSVVADTLKGKVVRGVQDVKMGDHLHIRPLNGNIHALVEEIN